MEIMSSDKPTKKELEKTVIKLVTKNTEKNIRIKKAIEYINYMFDKANENDIIDDLLKIEKILKGSEEK